MFQIGPTVEKNTIIDCNVHVVIKRERLTNPYNIIHGNNLRKLLKKIFFYKMIIRLLGKQ